MHDLLTANKDSRRQFNWIVPQQQQEQRQAMAAKQRDYQRQRYHENVTAEQIDEWQQYMVKKP